MNIFKGNFTKKASTLPFSEEVLREAKRLIDEGLAEAKFSEKEITVMLLLLEYDTPSEFNDRYSDTLRVAAKYEASTQAVVGSLICFTFDLFQPSRGDEVTRCKGMAEELKLCLTTNVRGLYGKFQGANGIIGFGQNIRLNFCFSYFRSFLERATITPLGEINEATDAD